METPNLYICGCSTKRIEPTYKYCPDCGKKVTVRPACIDKVCVGYEGGCEEYWVSIADFKEALATIGRG